MRAARFDGRIDKGWPYEKTKFLDERTSWETERALSSDVSEKIDGLDYDRSSTRGGVAIVRVSRQDRWEIVGS